MEQDTDVYRTPGTLITPVKRRERRRAEMCRNHQRLSTRRLTPNKASIWLTNRVSGGSSGGQAINLVRNRLGLTHAVILCRQGHSTEGGAGGGATALKQVLMTRCHEG